MTALQLYASASQSSCSSQCINVCRFRHITDVLKTLKEFNKKGIKCILWRNVDASSSTWQQTIYTITTVSRWAPRISVTNSVSDQNVKYGLNPPFCSWVWVEQWPEKCFFRTLWCHSEFDLWPFGYKISSLHHFILLDICVRLCHN